MYGNYVLRDIRSNFWSSSGTALSQEAVHVLHVFQLIHISTYGVDLEDEGNHNFSCIVFSESSCFLCLNRLFLGLSRHWKLLVLMQYELKRTHRTH